MKLSISHRLPGSLLRGSDPAIVQGVFVILKAGGDSALAGQRLDHLNRYQTLLFSHPFGAT